MYGIESIRTFLFDYTLRNVALGAAILGIVSGTLGTFAVLRKQSLLGDAISHAALPGIALAFLFTGSKTPIILMIGAAIAGWAGTLAVLTVVKNTRIKEDSALGIILSVFFGFGLVLMTFIQKKPNAAQAGLDKFLFGQAATLMERDVITMTILGLITLIILMLFWKEFKLLSFDLNFGTSLGFPMRKLEIVLTALIVIAIVIGLQTVGVVLMSAMIVAPAAAARQWTDKLGVMVLLAGLFGAIAGISGAVISSTFAHIPTGPTIVLSISVIVLISLLLAPNRGLIWNWMREFNNRKQLAIDAVLSDLYVLAAHHQTIEHGHELKVLRAMSIGHGGTDRSLDELEKRGLAQQINIGKWALTAHGYEEAERLEHEREVKS